MNDNLFKHINEYFNTFNQKDYTIYVDGTPTEWCKLNDYSTYVIWKIPSDSDWHGISVCQIEAIRLTPTTMEIIKTNGKEYKLVAKPKAGLKEEITEKIISLLKIKLSRIFYESGIKEEINEIMYFLDKLERINKG